MCTITIEDVVGIGPEPTSIRVLGTVEDCVADPVEGDRVIVSISCNPGGEPFAELAADVTGQTWEITFDVPPDAGCGCGQPVFVTARCATQDSCAATWDEPLRCPECPTVTFQAPEPGEELVRCNPDRSASVTLRALIDNITPGEVRVFIECGPNGQLEAPDNFIELAPGQIGTVEAHCNYPTPSTPQPFVRFTDLNNVDLGCPEVPIPVDPVDCPCPEVEVSIEEIDGCTATIKATIVPPGGCSITWNFGDIIDDVPQDPEVEVEFPCADTYPASVTVDCGENCSVTEPFLVTIEDCDPCPTGACCLPDGGCVELTERECLSRGGEYKGDDTACADVECEGEDPGGDGGNGGFDWPDWPDFFCRLLLFSAVFALLLAAFLALSAGCAGFVTPPAKAALAGSLAALAVALILLLLWWWLCSDLGCDSLNTVIKLLSYLVLVSALVSVILIIIGNPCGLGGLLGSGYIGAFLALAVRIGEETGCYGPLEND